MQETPFQGPEVDDLDEIYAEIRGARTKRKLLELVLTLWYRMRATRDGIRCRGCALQSTCEMLEQRPRVARPRRGLLPWRWRR